MRTVLISPYNTVFFNPRNNLTWLVIGIVLFFNLRNIKCISPRGKVKFEPKPVGSQLCLNPKFVFLNVSSYFTLACPRGPKFWHLKPIQFLKNLTHSVGIHPCFQGYREISLTQQMVAECQPHSSRSLVAADEKGTVGISVSSRPHAGGRKTGSTALQPCAPMAPDWYLHVVSACSTMEKYLKCSGN